MDLRQTNNRIIERLTKVLGFDVHFYSKSFFWLSLGQTSGILRGVVTTFLMARWLPRNTLGEFRYILAVFAIAGMFSASGISAGIIRGIAKGDTAIVKAGMKRILTISPFGSVILFIAALERWIVGEPIIAVAFIFAGIVFPIYSICGLYGSILTGQEKIKRLTKIAIMNNSIFAILFFVIIWRTKALLPIFITYLGFDVLIRSILTWNEIKKLPKQGSAESHIKLSDHLNAIGIVQALAAQLDQLLLHRLAGYGTLANYSIATLIPEQMKDFVNAIGGVMLRRFSTREQNQKTLTGTRKHFWTMFGLSAIMISAYALIAPIAIPLLFPQYKNEVLPSIIYATGLLGLASVVGINYFQAHHHLKALWKFYSINTTLQILTNVILIPIFGSWGAITSKTITRLAGIPFSYPRNNIKNTTDDTKASS